MSDPAKNSEIEDVLSSIRRLVSGNGGGAAGGMPSMRRADPPLTQKATSQVPVVQEFVEQEPLPKVTREPAPVAERLVLTPSLRVEEQDDFYEEIAESAPEMTDQDMPETTSLEHDVNDQDEVASHVDDAEVEAEEALTTFLQNAVFAPESEENTADLGAEEEEVSETTEKADHAEDLSDEDDHPEEAADQQWQEPEVETASETPHPDEAHHHEPHQDDAYETDSYSAEEPVEAVLSDAIDNLDVPNDVTAETPQQDTGQDAQDADQPDEDPTTDEMMSEAPEGDAEEALSVPDDFAESEAPEIEARLEGWRTYQAEAVETPYEPDEPGDSDYAGSPVETLEWQDHATDDDDSLHDNAPEADLADLAGNLQHEAEDIAEAVYDRVEDELADIEADTFVDEEVLREMVSDIVRQELQGALGERITRNVRKLVRREIHRALAAHDLD